jgi:MFS family permease
MRVTADAGGLRYRRLLRERGCLDLALVAVACRLGFHVWKYGLVLFTVTQFRSPWLTGLAVLCSTVPPLVTGPLAGAVMDRAGVTRALLADCLLSAAAAVLIAGLSATGHLGPAVLLAVITAGALTTPFSTAGLRSLFPRVVPSHLWSLMNAVDLTAYEAMRVLAAAVVGLLAAALAPAAPLVAAALAFAAGAAVLLRLRGVDAAARAGGSLLEGTWRGLRYVLRENRALRNLALVMTLHGAATGAALIAVTVLVLTGLHGGELLVGWLWVVQGLAVAASGTVAGRLIAPGRERTAVVGGLAGMAAGYGLVAAAPSPVVAVAGVALVGLASGAFSVGVLTLRQRRIDPARYGSAIAVSMTLNSVGTPIGAAAAGFALAWLGGAGTTAAAGALLLAAAALAAVAARPER